MPGLVFSESVFLKLIKGDFFSPLTNCISYPFCLVTRMKKLTNHLDFLFQKQKQNDLHLADNQSLSKQYLST